MSGGWPGQSRRRAPGLRLMGYRFQSLRTTRNLGGSERGCRPARRLYLLTDQDGRTPRNRKRCAGQNISARSESPSSLGGQRLCVHGLLRDRYRIELAAHREHRLSLPPLQELLRGALDHDINTGLEAFPSIGYRSEGRPEYRWV